MPFSGGKSNQGNVAIVSKSPKGILKRNLLSWIIMAMTLPSRNGALDSTDSETEKKMLQRSLGGKSWEEELKSESNAWMAVCGLSKRKTNKKVRMSKTRILTKRKTKTPFSKKFGHHIMGLDKSNFKFVNFKVSWLSMNSLPQKEKLSNRNWKENFILL